MTMVFGGRLADLNRDETPPLVSEAFLRAARQTIDAIKHLNESGLYVTVTDLVGSRTRIGVIFKSSCAHGAEIDTFEDFRDQVQPGAQARKIDLQDIVSITIEDPFYPIPGRIVLPRPENHDPIR